jgi:hypothetical protein
MIPAELGGGSGVIRRDGVHLDPDGRLEAVVRTSAFDGAITRLRVALTTGEELELTVPVDAAPPVGTPVRLRVDQHAVQRLSGAPPSH